MELYGSAGKNNDALIKIINGLKKLEYRGYDSAGIYFSSTYKDEKLIKSEGKISNLENILKNHDTNYSVGIGHTRWATHGIANTTNAHPHLQGSVALVHNGIIENYSQLKDFLLSKNYIFSSQTDTEIAAGYIDFEYKKTHDKIEAIKNACSKFKGSYAFGIIFKDEPESIYAAKKDSPLIIGISDDSNFISSDISAIIEYTDKFINMQNGEFAKITKDSYTIYDKNGNICEKEVQIADIQNEEYSKNGYDHFMLKEINEQPKVIDELFKRYLDENSILNTTDFSKYENIHIVACGSAMHAGLVGKYLIEKFARIETSVEIASEYRYKDPIITEKTLVIIISQSGETADTIAALRMAKEKGATILGIVNVVSSTIANESDILFYTYAGPEIAVATTKGYTSQVALLSIIALKLAKINVSEKNIIKNDMLSMHSLMQTVISKSDTYKEIANLIYNKENLFFIGRGNDYSTSMEGALKLKEISYIHSEAYPAGELKHGTISLIDENVPVIAIATQEELFEKTVSNIKEVKARGAFVIFITTDKLDLEGDFYDKKIVIPDSSCFTNSILTICALQLVSYYTAKLRGCDIDKPKNLAKSVTVE